MARQGQAKISYTGTGILYTNFEIAARAPTEFEGSWKCQHGFLSARFLAGTTLNDSRMLFVLVPAFARIFPLTHEARPGCGSMAYDHGRVHARSLEIFQARPDLLAEKTKGDGETSICY